MTLGTAKQQRDYVAGSPTTARRARIRHRVRARARAGGGRRGRGRARPPAFDVPYELPFIAVTERRSRALSTSSTRCCSVRSPRRSGCSGSSSASGASRRRRRPGDADRRPGARVRRPRRAAGPAHVQARARRRGVGAGEQLRERARRGEQRGSPRARASGLALLRSAARPTRAGGGRPGLAGRRQGRGRPAEIDRLILHQAVTVIALELLRRRVADTPSAVSPATCSRRSSRRARRRGARAPPGAVRARRARTTLVLAPPRPAGAIARRAGAGRGAARRGLSGLVARTAASCAR